MSNNSNNPINRMTFKIIEDSIRISNHNIINENSIHSLENKYYNPLILTNKEKELYKIEISSDKNPTNKYERFKNEFNSLNSISSDTITDNNNNVNINKIPYKEIDLKNSNIIQNNSIKEIDLKNSNIIQHNNSFKEIDLKNVNIIPESNRTDIENNDFDENPVKKIQLNPPPKLTIMKIINNNHNLIPHNLDFDNINKNNQSNKEQVIIRSNHIELKNDLSDREIHFSTMKFFSLLKNDSIFYLLCMLDVNTIKNLLNINKYFRLIINTQLRNVYYKEIISRIKNANKNIEILKNKIIYTKVKKSLKIDIITKIRFLPLKEDDINPNNITLIYIYKNISQYDKNKKERYIDYYSFDIFDENSENFPSIYMLREFTPFNLDNLQKPYIQPILPFKVYDQALLNFQIFSPQKHFVEPKEIRIKIKQKKIPNTFDNNIKNPRICEYEDVCYHWKNLSFLKEKKEVMIQLENIFNSNFKILRVLYDDIGYLVFKVFLKAFKSGEIDNKDEIGMKFIIRQRNDIILNEIKKNDLLFEQRNDFELRVGDTIIFYLTK